MNPELITKEKVEYFFNKYKYNSELISHLERKLLKESYDFQKWESLRLKKSELTRKLFAENEKLIAEYIDPVIKNPAKLHPDILHTFLIQITFFLFENNIDSHITDDLLNAILNTPEILNDNVKFNALMNLGISKTIACSDTFENIISIFEEAMQIFPTYEAADDLDTCVHLAFCRTYEMLAFDLLKSDDYDLFIKIYNSFDKLLRSASQELLTKMWGENADFDFHIDYLLRFCRIYGIFAAGQNNFECINNKTEENKYALQVIIKWLKDEFSQESKEGKINLMIFTYYNKYRQVFNLISKDQYVDALYMKFMEIQKNKDDELIFISPESAFPIDDDPVLPQFADMLDKMKLFNKTFSFVFVFLPALYKMVPEQRIQKRIMQHLYRYFEKSKYAEKGFVIDNFIIDLLYVISPSLENENEFIMFVQLIFINREISTTIHFGMVSSIAGICFFYLVSKRPDLFEIPNVCPTTQSVLESKMELLQFIKNASLMHDIGKLGITQLVNLHFRKITESEFSRIKKHVDYGNNIVQKISYLQHYSDFIVGHHKHWDNKGGYPSDFDLDSSPYKTYLNLVSIADAIDTSTDSRGRNYSQPKTFDEVFEEMKASENQRYSSELIQLIDQNEELKNELRNLTSTGRNYNSYQTYMRFVQPNTVFSAEDEKSISIFTEEYADSLYDFYKKSFPEVDVFTIEEHISQIITGSNSRIYIMHNTKKEIFGIVAGHIFTPINGEKKYYYINELIIHPDYRRKGLGSELIEVLREALKQEQVEKMRINIENDLNRETFFWIEGFTQTNKYLLEKEL